MGVRLKHEKGKGNRQEHLLMYIRMIKNKINIFCPEEKLSATMYMYVYVSHIMYMYVRTISLLKTNKQYNNYNKKTVYCKVDRRSGEGEDRRWADGGGGGKLGQRRTSR